MRWGNEGPIAGPHRALPPPPRAHVSRGAPGRFPCPVPPVRCGLSGSGFPCVLRPRCSHGLGPRRVLVSSSQRTTSLVRKGGLVPSFPVSVPLPAFLSGLYCVRSAPSLVLERSRWRAHPSLTPDRSGRASASPRQVRCHL